MKTIYIEEEVKNHPRVQRILQQYPNADLIECRHYGEVFNIKSQNFRIQKQDPALILAKKSGHFVLPTPESFGIGSAKNYYFSHLLNCPYDCRYCFLQGMYRSANYVLFVNYEDFMDDIESKITSEEHSYFFSGYDGDSLALDPLTHFAKTFIPFFAKQQHATLELRTKSVNIRPLLNSEPTDRVIVAFSFTPDEISKKIEHKVPLVSKRIEAMRKLAERGWRLGLRFDPLIYHEQFEMQYQTLLKSIFDSLNHEAVHSVSIGPLRFPEKMYRKIDALYPKENLLQRHLIKRKKHFSYSEDIENKMNHFVREHISKYISNQKIFSCSAI